MPAAKTLTPDVAEALSASYRAAVDGLLGPDDGPRITVEVLAGDGAPAVEFRGPEELVDRIEAALFPPGSEATDGR
jgi:hypothetical protein